jgi:N-acetylglucosamine-6-phosphate deacetylase
MDIPGFVDLQVNGYRGTDFSAPDLSEEALAAACRDLLARGTAALLPTVVTSPLEVYERNLPLAARVMARPEFAGRLLGLHLEGPFLSAEPGAVGAHNPAWVRPPDPALLDRMWEWAAGRVRLLTIAAEAPGAEDLARRAVALGITVSLGHQLADEAALDRLARAGATALTHLGNGVPNTLPRHRNPIWAGLAEDRLWAMIIADGHHLPPAVLKVMLRAKGVARTAVVSDASPVAGLPPGRYRVSGNDAVLEPSGLLHNPAKGCLVGSSATLLECMNHLASLGLCTAEELVALGLDNPLRLVGLDRGVLGGASAVTFDEGAGRFRLHG